jgi:hypothetical protein
MIEALSVLGAVLLFIAAVFEVLLIAGLPLGEFTMGGRHKVLPPAMRAAGAGSLLTQVFAGLILLQAGGFMSMWFSPGVTKVICYVFAGCDKHCYELFLNEQEREIHYDSTCTD